MSVELVCDHLCTLGEGPVWISQEKKICWVDIVRGEIHEYEPAQKKRTTLAVHQMVGAVALTKNRQYVAALQHGLAFINRQTGRVDLIGDPEAGLPGNRFNDGKCDPAGRFWAGTMPYKEDSPAGNVYCLDADLRISKKIDQVTVSNGMAWSLDHRQFYYIDSPTATVVSYDYDLSTGNISGKKLMTQFAPDDGSPDGMTIDNEGMLWIAHWGGWKLTRWNPQTRTKLSELALPVSKVTSCTFGGDRLSDLYISSARIDLTEKELRQQPLAGGLFVVRDCGYTGLPAVEFAGILPEDKK